MESLKRAWERAELLLETARQRPNKIRVVGQSNSTQPKWKSIHQKLTDLYIEECTREPKYKHLRNATHLLDKLVARDKLSCIVVNLYPGNEGFSVMRKGRSGLETETIRLPYEEAELLQYIDNEELPPILVDILEASETNIFHSGCVIAEVRDYRRSTSPSIYESHHVLLKPTTQSLVCDVNSLTSDGSRWSADDKMALESQLLLATQQEPLCLEPSVAVSLVANYLQHSKHKLGVAPIKNMTKRYSQAAINRKWKFEQHAAPSNLRLFDFVSRRKDRSKRSQPAINLRLGKQTPGVDTWHQKEVYLASPAVVDVDAYASVIAPRVSTNDCSLEFVEEYTLKSKNSNGKGYYCRLTVHLRVPDEVFLGELYTDRDYVESELKGTSCRFELGTKANVDMYLQQFIEIFTQESRQAVVITHEIKGQPVTTTTVPYGQLLSLGGVATQMATQHLTDETRSPNDVEDTPPQPPTPTSKISGANGSALSPGGTGVGPSEVAINPAPTSVPASSSSVAPLSAVPASVSQHSTGRSRASGGTPTRTSSESPGPLPTVPSMSPSHGSARTRTNPTPPPPATVHGNNKTNAPTTTTTVASAVPSKMTPPYMASSSPPTTTRRLQPVVESMPSVGILSRIHQPNIHQTAGSNVPTGMVATSIAMMSPSLITTPTGVFVANLVTHSQPGAINQSMATTSTTSTAIMMATGIAQSPAMVSFPVGLTGNLSSQNLSAARFIASSLQKGTGVGLQSAGSPVGLLQMSGATSPQTLFNPGVAHRSGGIMIGGPTSSPRAIAASMTPPSQGATTPPSGQNMTPTLVTFASQQPSSLQLSQQQIASLQLQQLHHHQQQQQQQHNHQSVQAKGKGRKRGGTTPPK